MIWQEALLALLIALAVSVVLIGPVGWRHPRGPATRLSSWIFVFLTIFLFTWAIGAWTRPFGPAVWDVYWVPFLWIAILAGLFLVAMSGPPPARREPPPQTSAEETGSYAAAGIFGFFFWVLTAALVILLAVRLW